MTALDPTAVRADYERRGAAHEARARAERAVARRLSWARLALFVVAVVLGARALADAAWRAPSAAVAGAAALAFAVVAHRHRRRDRAAVHHAARAALCREGIARIDRRWDLLPPTEAPVPPPEHPYAGDLGVVGHAALLQLLGPLGAATGAATAVRWLCAPAAPTEVRDRQDAVRELAARTEFREELAVGARVSGLAPRRQVQRFLAWCDEAPWLLRRRGLRTAALAVPLVTLGTAAAVGAGALPAESLYLPIVLGVVVAAAAREAGRRLAAAAPGSDAFRVFREQFELVLGEVVHAPAWHRVQGALAPGGRPAPVALRRLQRLLDAAELRHSPMLHAAVNVLTAWDVHVLAALERWRVRAGEPREWFAALGEAEALCGLATLLHDNPGWVMAVLDPDRTALLEAEGLAHPLLPPATRVANDVVVGPPGTFVLVTGSNMAGKSTLLRAVGANAVLAQAGGPVCARRLHLPPLAVHTSMRVSDSLEAGVSLFLAELLRLRQIVDAARAREPGEPAILFLLDEILHGTNTAERQVAARRILGHLLEHGAIGMVSTHDLALADTPELRAAAHPVHFREQLGDGEGLAAMRFDYVLRPGLATSANALKLVELVGLG